MEENTIKKPTIKDWADDDKPREKLMKLGPSALSVAELLAILIRTGTRDENALELVKRLLEECGYSLKKLGQMSTEELCHKYKGIGMAKAVTILAACELGARRQDDKSKKEKITRSEDIYNHFIGKMQDLAVEECHVLLLNHGHRIIDSRLISRGAIARALVDVREVLRYALLAHATSIVLCHNHPSGNENPSIDDDRITEKMKNAAKTMDITLLDHLIITDGAYYSYADDGKL